MKHAQFHDHSPMIKTFMDPPSCLMVCAIYSIKDSCGHTHTHKKVVCKVAQFPAVSIGVRKKAKSCQDVLSQLIHSPCCSEGILVVSGPCLH